MGNPTLSSLCQPPLMSSPWYGYGDFTSVVSSHKKVPEQGGAQSRGRAGFTSAQDTSNDVVGDYTWSNWVVWKARDVEARDAALDG